MTLLSVCCVTHSTKMQVATCTKVIGKCCVSIIENIVCIVSSIVPQCGIVAMVFDIALIFCWQFIALCVMGQEWMIKYRGICANALGRQVRQ